MQMYLMEKKENISRKILKKLSKELNIGVDEIYLASTGVIGEPLEHSKIISKIPFLIANLNKSMSLGLRQLMQ